MSKQSKIIENIKNILRGYDNTIERTLDEKSDMLTEICLKIGVHCYNLGVEDSAESVPTQQYEIRTVYIKQSILSLKIDK